MALIKCPECGKDISSETKNCPNCGCPIKKDDNKKKSKMLAAVILNTLAVVIPVLFFIIMNSLSYGEPESSGGVSVEFDSKSTYSSNGVMCCLLLVLAVAILGYIIFFIKSELVKRILAFIYLFAAVIGLVWMFASMAMAIVFTCGFGAILLVPGILQVAAGVKYVSATGK